MSLTGQSAIRHSAYRECLLSPTFENVVFGKAASYQGSAPQDRVVRAAMKAAARDALYACEADLVKAGISTKIVNAKLALLSGIVEGIEVILPLNRESE